MPAKLARRNRLVHGEMNDPTRELWSYEDSNRGHFSAFREEGTEML